MADIIVELDQQDHLEFDLKQEDQMDIDLQDIKAVVIGGIKYEEDPVDSGFVKYNAETDKYTTITPEDTVTKDSENIVTSKAIYDYVKTHVDTKIADLVNSAPEMLDTLGEVAKAIQENETVIDALNSTIENKQDKLTAGENINIDENGVISAVGGGLNIADLPKFTNKLYINMANSTALAGVFTLPIVSSSNFVVDWGDGITTDYVEATTEISHTYSDASFAGWVYIYGDWKGIQFTNTKNENSLTIQEILYDNNITDVPNYAFYYCNNVKVLELPNSILSLGTGMCFQCKNLIKLRLPELITTVPNAFQDIETLKDIVLPKNINTIESMSFYGCKGIIRMTIPNSVTTIGGSALTNGIKTIMFEGSTPPKFSNIYAANADTMFVPYKSLKSYKTKTNLTQNANKIYPVGGNYSETLTIPSTSWDTSTNTVIVEAVGSTTEARNIITWNVSSGGVQTENTYGLKCTAQGTMSLTFSCETIPTEDVEVSVRYMLTNY